MKDIIGYEKLYAITSCGRVWSYKRNKFLSSEKVNGYERVTLCKDGKRKHFLIHRLVAEAYIPNPNSYDTVDHINNDKTKNYVNNLQWMGMTDNIKKAQNESVICIELNKVFTSQMEASRQLGISQGNISMVLKGQRKTAGGYHWEKF